MHEGVSADSVATSHQIIFQKTVPSTIEVILFDLFLSVHCQHIDQPTVILLNTDVYLDSGFQATIHRKQHSRLRCKTKCSPTLV